MSEIKNKIVWLNSDQINVQQLEGFLIEDKHSVADIVRWLVEERLVDDVSYFIEHQEEL